MPRRSSASCSLPKSLKAHADHQLRLALLAGAIAHFLEAIVDEIQFELVVILDVERGRRGIRPFS